MTTTTVVLLALVLALGLACLLMAARLRRHRALLDHLHRLLAEPPGSGAGQSGSPPLPGELAPLANAIIQFRDRLRQADAGRDQLQQVLASMGEAVLLTRTDGRIQWANTAAERLLGRSAAELRNQPASTLVAPGHADTFSVADTRNRTRESVFVTAAGEQVPVSWTCAEVPAADATHRGFVITARNISERKLQEQRIRYLARIDALTKVPNRMQFQHLLQRAIARARRGQHRLALIYLDVDRFKEINDTYGHTAGDLCLETLTDRLGRILPDSAVVGRLAGDEFGVILDNLDPGRNLRAEVVATTRLLQDTIAEPLAYQSHQIYMSASAGISLYPSDGNNVIDLIRNADAALYKAKRQGGGALEVYNPDMNAAAVERLMLKSRLRLALEKNELSVLYQPKVDLRDGSLVGAEALVRWELEDRGMVLPSEFIPLAEESNLILELGEWVLDRVCTDLHNWHLPDGSPLRVSVNLSLRQLKQRNFIARVREIMHRHGVHPGQLELEITETTLMEDPRRTVRILDELHELGLGLAIDDFGTGYSSLSALQQFPVGTLKIDQSFVRHATTDHDQATIVAMIVEMGHSLSKDVVAEGVESEDQLRFLRALNCDQAQGPSGNCWRTPGADAARSGPCWDTAAARRWRDPPGLRHNRAIQHRTPNTTLEGDSTWAMASAWAQASSGSAAGPAAWSAVSWWPQAWGSVPWRPRPPATIPPRCRCPTARPPQRRR
jgi:diguanylate cyclase (GGDEF)-like protein/PAS domain S-box-containing protein